MSPVVPSWNCHPLTSQPHRPSSALRPWQSLSLSMLSLFCRERSDAVSTVPPLWAFHLPRSTTTVAAGCRLTSHVAACISPTEARSAAGCNSSALIVCWFISHRTQSPCLFKFNFFVICSSEHLFYYLGNRPRDSLLYITKWGKSRKWNPSSFSLPSLLQIAPLESMDVLVLCVSSR